MDRDRLSSFFWVVLFGGIIVFLLTTTFTAYLKNHKLNNYALKLQSECAQLTETNRELANEINALKHDTAYLESLMRNELKMAGPDELVLRKQN